MAGLNALSCLQRYDIAGWVTGRISHQSKICSTYCPHPPLLMANSTFD